MHHYKEEIDKNWTGGQVLSAIIIVGGIIISGGIVIDKIL